MFLWVCWKWAAVCSHVRLFISTTTRQCTWDQPSIHAVCYQASRRAQSDTQLHFSRSLFSSSVRLLFSPLSSAHVFLHAATVTSHAFITDFTGYQLMFGDINRPCGCCNDDDSLPVITPSAVICLNQWNLSESLWPSETGFWGQRRVVFRTCWHERCPVEDRNTWSL